MPNSKRFSRKVEQATIRRHRAKFFQLLLQQTGDIEEARKILKERPYATHITGVGTVFTNTPNPNLTELQNITVDVSE